MSAEKFHDWKERALDDFARWLDVLEEPPLETQTSDAPDLYSLFEELAVLRNETRKGNRRGAEVFAQVAEALERCEARLESLAAEPEAPGDALPRNHCLALVELLDRMNRIADALDRPPATRRWFAPSTDWNAAWTSLRQGFAILRRHTGALLENAGVRPLKVRGETFDPLRMIAVATEPTPDAEPNRVLEEIRTGYEIDGEILRLAEVKVSAALNPSESPAIESSHE